MLKILLSIYRNEHIRPSREHVELLRTYYQERAARCTAPAEGLQALHIALEAVEIAANEIGLRGDVLTAALLEPITHTEAEADEAALLFGQGVSNALKAFLRAASLSETKRETMHTDDFRNLFVAKTGDMRAALLLIARSVALMRHGKEVEKPEVLENLATEAALLYAPLAHKLGIYRLKSELEDLSLKYLEHDAYYMIKEALNATKRSRDAYIERFTAPIREMLDADGIHYHMKGRTKSIHSIWQKMKKQQCGFSGVYDLFAIRIIIDAPLEKEQEMCWRAFSLITAKYESNLKRLRDWLTVPKANGYESLHITVLGPEGKWVEVQIRTERMDEIAEHGLAAHWRYKGIKSTGGGVESWLADIRTALETGDDKALGESFGTPGKQHQQEVYVFSPKGDLFRLPAGATVLDFAYAIHTGVGNRCVGAKIGDRAVPIRHVLESGQTVSITTAANQTPKTEWLNICVSPHARAKIRSAVRELGATDALMAREILERKFKNRKIEWDESLMNQVVKKMGYKEAQEFYRAIADERLDVNRVLETFLALGRREQGQAERTPAKTAADYNFEQDQEARRAGTDDELVIGANLKGIEFQMAHCCNPGYGDDVFGFVTVSGGIKIHRTTCPNAPALHERFPYRIVRARWAGKGSSQKQYPITLRVVGHDDIGIVNNITSIINKEQNIMLRGISIQSEDGLFSGWLTVLIDDTGRLPALIKKIRGVKGVKAVSRS